MRRRDLLSGLPAALALGGTAAAQQRFRTCIESAAAELASRPHQPVSTALPSELARLDYDSYRDLRFRPEMSVWRDLPLPFQLQMFHRGGLHAARVDLHEVVDGEIRTIRYRPDMFSSGPLAPPPARPDLGFAGFRIHTPINESSRFDEFAVFLGASYFRAVSRGGVYGLSARAIEIGSGESGEEFPAFRSFFIERPAPGATSITVHALLDGPSLAGAYTFVIFPGESTVFEVEAALYPRRSTSRVGLAPLTSMYLFGSEEPRRFDDFRPEVHDSDGLLLDRGPSERLWRSLTNPVAARISAFPGDLPRSFGLLQRGRGLENYQDLEAIYHRRPSAWVEPLGAWGSGAVHLVELPARSEGEDNIVASWRPAAGLRPHQPLRVRYKLNWSASLPESSPPLARVNLWRTGQGGLADRRRFVIEFDFAGRPQAEVRPEVTATAGAVFNVTLQANEVTDAVRLSFEFDPQGARISELQARLLSNGVPVSERWIRPWGA